MSNRHQTRRKRLIGGLGTLQPNIPRVNSNILLRQKTFKNLNKPSQVSVVSNKNIRTSIFANLSSTSPMTLTMIKSTTSDYLHKYFKIILTKIGMTDVHRMYTDETRTKKIYIYELEQIAAILRKAIQDIETTYSSDNFDFGIDTSQFVVQQLNNYLNYSVSHADEFNCVPMDAIEYLFQ